VNTVAIGIDLTDSARFESSRHLKKFISKFRVNGNTAKDAAKTWACIEAIVKAEPTAFTPTDITVEFPKNRAPRLIDHKNVLKYQYQLSVSHEKTIIIAVALGQLKIDQLGKCCYN
jgi:phosphopantetheinyl transferase (holo-ACP synthase)